MQRINAPGGQFIDGDPWNNVQGTAITAAWLNAVQNELSNICSAANIPLDPAKNDQVMSALVRLFFGVPSAPDTGTPNAYVISPLPPQTSLVDNETLVFSTGNANTGPATLSVNGLAARPIVGAAHQPLAGGEIKAGSRCLVVYSAALSSFILLTATGGAQQISPGTAGNHAARLDQLGPLARVQPGAHLALNNNVLDVQPNHWTVLNSPQAPVTLSASRNYAINTVAGPLPVNLPPNPVEGDYIYFRDIGPVWQANPLTINGNGKTIYGDTQMLCNVSGFEFGLVYQNNDWKISMTVNLNNLIQTVLQNNSGAAGPQISAVGVAGELLPANALACVHSRDKRLWEALPPDRVGAALRPIFAAADTGINWAIAPPAAVPLTGNNICALPASFKAVRLINGNIACCWTTGVGIAFSVQDCQGGLVAGMPGSIGGGVFPSICALAGGGFALAWRSNNFVWHAPISATGVVGQIRQFDAGVTHPTVNTIGIFALANGGYVVVADIAQATKFAPKFGIFSATGTPVVAPIYMGTAQISGPVTVGAGTTQVAQLSGGQLLIAWACDAGNGVALPAIGLFSAVNGAPIGVSIPVPTPAATPAIISVAAFTQSDRGIVSISYLNSPIIQIIWVNSAGAQVAYKTATCGGACVISNALPYALNQVFLSYRVAGEASVKGIIMWDYGDISPVDYVMSAAPVSFFPPQLASIGGNRLVVFNGSTNSHAAVVAYQHLTPSSPFEPVQAVSSCGVALSQQNEPAAVLLPCKISLQPAWAQLWTVISMDASASQQYLRTETRCLQARGLVTPVGIVSVDTPAGVDTQAQITGTATLRNNFGARQDVDSSTAAQAGLALRMVGNKALIGTEWTEKAKFGQVMSLAGIATAQWTAPVNCRFTLTGMCSLSSAISVNGTAIAADVKNTVSADFQLRGGDVITVATTGGASAIGAAIQI